MVLALICATSLAWWLTLEDTRAKRALATPSALAGVLWPEPRTLAAFELRTQYQQYFAADSFRGHWSLVFFGYLDCPDICPMSLAAMRQMRELLRQRGRPLDDVEFMLVSVDTVHDNAARMRQYLDAVAPGFIGLTGSVEMIDRLSTSMAVYYVDRGRSEGATGVDRIEHSSSVMIVGPDGRVHGAFQPPLQPAVMADAFEQLRRTFRASS